MLLWAKLNRKTRRAVVLTKSSQLAAITWAAVSTVGTIFPGADACIL
jgi:hypothetical protein